MIWGHSITEAFGFKMSLAAWTIRCPLFSLSTASKLATVITCVRRVEHCLGDPSVTHFRQSVAVESLPRPLPIATIKSLETPLLELVQVPHPPA